MIGNVNLEPVTSSMSLIHALWESALLADNPINFTSRLANSGSSLAKAPNSVVQTGVKSSGCENNTAHESPKYSWNEIGPLEVSAVKSGAVDPKRKVEDIVDGVIDKISMK